MLSYNCVDSRVLAYLITCESYSILHHHVVYVYEHEVKILSLFLILYSRSLMWQEIRKYWISTENHAKHTHKHTRPIQFLEFPSSIEIMMTVKRVAATLVKFPWLHVVQSKGPEVKVTETYATFTKLSRRKMAPRTVLFARWTNGWRER